MNPCGPRSADEGDRRGQGDDGVHDGNLGLIATPLCTAIYPYMNGSQSHVDFTPLSPVTRSAEQEAALEGCLWFDIGAQDVRAEAAGQQTDPPPS